MKVGAGAGGEDSDAQAVGFGHAASTLGSSGANPARATSSFGKRPSVARSRPAASSASIAASDVVGAEVAVRAVARQAVVGVLGDHLRAAAAEDLDAARAAHARARPGTTTSRIALSRSAAGESVLWRTGSGRLGHRRGIADVAARARWARAPSGRRSGAGSRGGDSLRPRPTPTPSGTGASGPACPPASTALHTASVVPVPRADDPAGDAIGRRGRGLDDARPGQVADDGAHRVLLTLVRELVQVQAVARRRALGRAHDLARDRLQQVLADLRALDEEHVQALVAAGGEQQARAGRPSRPARPASW